MSKLAGIKIGDWTAIPALNVLERDSRSVKIEPRAMDVLVALANSDGAVVSVEELIATVWKGVVVGDGSVYLAIRQLRQVLDHPATGTHYIETIAKRGYRLTVPVQEVAPAIEPEASQPVAGQDHPKRRTLHWFAAAAAAAVLLVATGLSLKRNAATVKSVAVLPFDNLSSDAEQEYFADGVTEEILNALASVSDLRVIARTSSFLFKDRTSELDAIAKALDVEYVLSGSVRKDGEQVRIAAQLSDVRSGHQLWSETYERKLVDVFAIQDEIARSTANALQVKLGVGEIARMPGMTRDVTAYDEYLRAHALNLDGAFAPAIAHLQRAVALDPAFALAWAGQNGVYTNGALSKPPEEAEEWRRLGMVALERARELTPDSPAVLLQYAVIEARRCNWVGAAPLYEGLQPAYAKYGAPGKAWAPRGIFLTYAGRPREAIPVLERARADDPLAPALAMMMSRAYLFRGDTAAAMAEIERGLALQGLKRQLQVHGFWIAMNANDTVEMKRRVQALRQIPDNSGRGVRVFEMVELLDTPGAALAEVRRLAALGSPVDRVPLALWAAYLQAPGLALELIAPESRNGEAIPALWMPVMQDVRKLPAFKDLVRDAGLVDYWRAYGWSDFCRPAGDGDFTCS